ncbi:MAG: hypothetical protein J5928_00955 [Firmicutes bacterium]|nr:hypothetical protein [Bacillota bacterium]
MARSTASTEAIKSLTISFENDKDGNPKTVFEYGDGIVKTRELVSEHGGELFVDVDEIDCNKVGITEVTYLMTTTDEYGRVFTNSETVKYEVKDRKAPEIKLDAEKIELEWGEEFDAAANILSVKDPVDGDLVKSDDRSKGKYIIESNVDTEVSGTYTVTVKAMDSNGNVSEAEYEVTVAEKPVEPEPETEGGEATSSNNLESEFNGKPYQIRVNRAANTVTIYTVGEEGTYSLPFKAMICVAPINMDCTEPVRYYTGAQWDWVGTYGDVYAQYATQFAPGTLIQSVPYNSPVSSDLRWEDYNKLGSNADTYGGIWLTVEDAKWIYDNVGSGTEVLFYDDYSEAGPLGQPGAMHIDPSSENKGWDPTDPDSENPWR